MTDLYVTFSVKRHMYVLYCEYHKNHSILKTCARERSRSAGCFTMMFVYFIIKSANSLVKMSWGNFLYRTLFNHDYCFCFEYMHCNRARARTFHDIKLVFFRGCSQITIHVSAINAESYIKIGQTVHDHRLSRNGFSTD